MACVREEFKKIKNETTQRTTYAQALNAPRQIPSAEEPTASSLPSNKPALIFSTAQPTNTRQEVITAFKKHVSFKRLNYAPTSIRAISNNKLRVEFNTSSQRDETIEHLKDCSEGKAEPARCLKPMCILKGISNDTPANELIDIIKNQNEEVASLIEKEDDLKVRFKRNNRNPNLYNAVLITHPRVWRQILTCGRICVDHQRVHAQDFSPFLQCHKCLQFGHIKTRCTTEESPCSYCAETTHDFDACPIRSKKGAPTCVNCRSHNDRFNLHNDTKHKATDSLCPRLRAMKLKITSRIDYGSN